MKRTLLECFEAHEQLNAFGTLIHERLRVHEYLQLVNLGERAFQEGSPNLGVMFLIEGKLELYRRHEDGGEARWKFLKPGDLIIDMEADPENSGSMPFSARAMSLCEISLVPRLAVFNIIDALTEFRDAYFEHLNSYHADLAKQLSQLESMKAEARVKRMLLEKREEAGQDQFELPAKREVAASLVGLDEDGLNGFLNHWVDEGAIELKGRFVTLVDKSKL